MNLIFSLSVSRRQLLIGLALLGVIGLGCAEIAPPPGGEIDKVGPTLLSSDPADGALEVVGLQTITLTFSEKLTKPKQGRGVFVSPRTTFQPDIKWKSEQIQVVLADPLRADQTYVVSVSSDVTDLRKNRLDSAITIAFSTGTYIDSGSAAGIVLTTEDKPAAGWAIGLYSQLDFPDIPKADSTYPDYLTSCDPQGHFALRYLPPGDYRLVAFDDRNRDDLFNPSVEAFAVPDRAFTIGGDLKLDNLILTEAEFDSLTPQIISAVVTGDGLLRVRLNRPIDPTWLGRQPEKLQLSAVAYSTTFQAEAILEATDNETAVLSAWVPGLVDGLYQLQLEYAADRPQLILDSVKYHRLEDRAAPTLVSSEPSLPILFAHAVTISHVYSEPIDTALLTDQTFTLWESDSLLVATTLEWEDCFHLNLKPARIRPATRYRLDISEFDLVDLAGNRLGDSVRSLSFATHNADSLGSISGTVLITEPSNQDAPAHLKFQAAGTGRSFNIVVKPDKSAPDTSERAFDIDLPPGKYLLRGFVDRDQDGKLTPGGIRPFRVAETRAIYADTIAVRARFETAGIQLLID